MKILFLTIENHPGTLGGIQTFGRNLKSLYEKDLVFLTNKVDIEKKYNVEDVIEVFSSNRFLRAINKVCKNFFRKFLIIQNIKKIKPDICILSSEKELEFVKNISSKVILVQHSSVERYLEVSKEFYPKIKLREPEYMICLSEKDKKSFQKKLQKTKINFKMIRFPNIIEKIESKKIKNRNLIILSRLENSAKRLDLAIKAMRKLPEFTLNIYGEGPAERLYKEIIERERLTNVFLKGGTDKVKEKLDDSSVYIITSDFEGYPVSSIEAMRRGLPIIIRDTFGAASDIVVDNTNGILLNKKWDEDSFVEAVRKIYNNYGYYSENSKKLGERYNKEIIKKEWDNLFKELIGC